ncbi:hypothetical protein [Roseivivax sediminis]|uniref:Uncharacterized protein n=1 Tax=Roseivivax sediminis TaxID=936889 RepID=A0A1I2CVL7_9RHOB|nr:hypothetical protein [Roseivivax sediminis]SFE72232.1 hypothetical protein SAMN04515678_114100 [Roseivivax sediminis]
MASLPETPTFHFRHAGSHKPLAWPKYKTKECWALVMCLMQMRGKGAGALIVHNWWGGGALSFTREFQSRRSGQIDTALPGAPIIEAHAMGIVAKVLALMLAALLTLLPITGIIAVTRRVLPRRTGPLVLYADGHLSGFALSLAAQAQPEGATYSLQHGLYRSDDIGSFMMIRNFVSGQICLWEGFTRQNYIEVGTDPARLRVVGQYGFGHLAPAEDRRAGRVLLCPPYDETQIEIFRQLETHMPEGTETLWSLHPMLRSAHSDLAQAALNTVSPPPALAICGDSGVLMDALSRGIPVITVADRPLATAHLSEAEAQAADAVTLDRLSRLAHDSLAADRQRFGFDIPAG